MLPHNRQTRRKQTRAVSTRQARETDETHVPTEQQATQENARLSSPDEHARRTPGHQEAPGKGAQAPLGVHPAEAAAAVTGGTGPAAGTQRFPRSHRLRKRVEFTSVQAEGRRRAAAHFVVITRKKDGPPSRLGITTSRKVGNSPQRNRIRRWVREFFRRRQETLQPPQDVVVIARSGAADLKFSDVERELANALRLPPQP